MKRPRSRIPTAGVTFTLLALSAACAETRPIDIAPVPKVDERSEGRNRCRHHDLAACLELWVWEGDGDPDVAKGAFEGRSLICRESSMEKWADSCAFAAQLAASDHHAGGADKRTALGFAQRACEHGSSKGCWIAHAIKEQSQPKTPEDHKDALRYLERGCALGDPSKCGGESYLSGCDYESGEACGFLAQGILSEADPTAEDLARSRNLLERGCQFESEIACDALASDLRTGRAGPKDATRARQILERQCQGNYPFACYHLAWMWKEGEGGVADAAKAEGTFARARTVATLQCPTKAQSCRLVGMLWRFGYGGPKDESKARGLLGTACDGGDATGCLDAGWMWKTGEGGSKDAAQARALYSKACARDDAACAGGGWLEFGAGHDDVASALNETACGAGASEACFNQGTVWLYLRRNVKEAIRSYGQSCDKGFASGCVQKACLVRSDSAAAADALVTGHLADAQKLCGESDKGDGESCLALADWFRAQGDAAREREFRSRGRQLLQQDCQKGDTGSCRVLKLR